MIDSTSSPFSLPGGWGRSRHESTNSLITFLILWATAPILGVGGPKVTSLAKQDTFTALITWEVLRVLGGLCRNRVEDQVYIDYYKSQYHKILLSWLISSCQWGVNMELGRDVWVWLSCKVILASFSTPLISSEMY